MGCVNVEFTDDEFEELKALKGAKTWHDYILHITRMDRLRALTEEEKRAIDKIVEECKAKGIPATVLYPLWPEGVAFIKGRFVGLRLDRLDEL